jgi:hypothetical protein
LSQVKAAKDGRGISLPGRSVRRIQSVWLVIDIGGYNASVYHLAVTGSASKRGGLMRSQKKQRKVRGSASFSFELMPSADQLEKLTIRESVAIL